MNIKDSAYTLETSRRDGPPESQIGARMTRRSSALLDGLDTQRIVGNETSEERYLLLSLVGVEAHEDSKNAYERG